MKSDWYSDKKNIDKIVFFVSHYIFFKFILKCQTKLEIDIFDEKEQTMLFENNIVFLISLIKNEFQSYQKQVRRECRNKTVKLKTIEKNDQTLIDESHAYDIFLINYQSKIVDKMYRVIIDESYVMRHSDLALF